MYLSAARLLLPTQTYTEEVITQEMFVLQSFINHREVQLVRLSRDEELRARAVKLNRKTVLWFAANQPVSHTCILEVSIMYADPWCLTILGWLT